VEHVEKTGCAHLSVSHDTDKLGFSLQSDALPIGSFLVKLVNGPKQLPKLALFPVFNGFKDTPVAIFYIQVANSSFSIRLFFSAFNQEGIYLISIEEELVGGVLYHRWNSQAGFLHGSPTFKHPI
jgi:hypothetical protein